MNSGLTGAQANNQAQMVLDRNDRRRDWGPSALNVENQASISGSYALPFGPGKRWIADTGPIGSKLIGGWQLNGIATFLSGFPFTPQAFAHCQRQQTGAGDRQIARLHSRTYGFNV
jgi:hypothetical protein